MNSRLKQTDDIVDFLDDLFYGGRWDEVQSYMDTVDLTSLETSSVCAIGMWTKHAKVHLPNRPKFLKRMSDELLRRGQSEALVNNTIKRYE